MTWLVARMKWLLLISGVLTVTMLYAAVAPRAAMVSTFGSALEGPAADVVARTWGALIALVGAMLLYAAWHPEVRPMVLVVAATSKAFFVLLVLAQGRLFLTHGAGLAVVCDSAMVILFVFCLVAERRR